jgi:hypothetical protein
MATISQLTKLTWALIILTVLLVGAIGAFMFDQLTIRGPYGMVMTLGRADFAKGKIISELKEGYEIRFWTPSARTKESQGIHDWEKIDNDDKLDAFAETLMNGQVIAGYSRFEVVGAGLGVRKRGAWWVATLNGDKGGTVEKFLAEYQKFWKPGEDTPYMQAFRITAGYPSWWPLSASK